MSFQHDFHLFHIHFQLDLIAFPNRQIISFSNLLFIVAYCSSSSIRKSDKFEGIDKPIINISIVLLSFRNKSNCNCPKSQYSEFESIDVKVCERLHWA